MTTTRGLRHGHSRRLHPGIGGPVPVASRKAAASPSRTSRTQGAGTYRVRGLAARQEQRRRRRVHGLHALTLSARPTQRGPAEPAPFSKSSSNASYGSMSIVQVIVAGASIPVDRQGVIPVQSYPRCRRRRWCCRRKIAVTSDVSPGSRPSRKRNLWMSASGGLVNDAVAPAPGRLSEQFVPAATVTTWSASEAGASP